VLWLLDREVITEAIELEDGEVRVGTAEPAALQRAADTMPETDSGQDERDVDTGDEGQQSGIAS
jgi:hypothetical protein